MNTNEEFALIASHAVASIMDGKHPSELLDENGSYYFQIGPTIQTPPSGASPNFDFDFFPLNTKPNGTGTGVTVGKNSQGDLVVSPNTSDKKVTLRPSVGNIKKYEGTAEYLPSGSGNDFPCEVESIDDKIIFTNLSNNEHWTFWRRW